MNTMIKMISASILALSVVGCNSAPSNEIIDAQINSSGIIGVEECAKDPNGVICPRLRERLAAIKERHREAALKQLEAAKALARKYGY